MPASSRARKDQRRGPVQVARRSKSPRRPPAAAAAKGAELEPADHARLAALAGLCHRRWSLPILAELHHDAARGGAGGAKFVTLANRLRLSRETLRDTLEDLIARDYLMRNPGVGHPMRPEYMLTEDGHDAGPAAAAVMAALRAAPRRQSCPRLEDVALRKWSLSALYAIARGQARFGQIKAALPQVTSRALALALKDLLEARLISRRITHDYPPMAVYEATRSGRRLARMLTPLR